MTNAAKTRMGLLFILVLLALFLAASLRSGSMTAQNAQAAVVSPLKRSASSVQQESTTQAPGSYEITGKPSISVTLINHILCSASSPACDTGLALYQLGVQYGIDPVFALAFFMHESSFGRLGVAVTNLGLGNIRCSGTPPGCRGGYRAYPDWSQGYRDWYSLLKYGYVEGHVSSRCPCITVAQIIPVYAPRFDHNNEYAYITAVETSVTTWRHQYLSSGRE